eukprot:SAG11_NODE_1842_length_4179_cov_2.865931_1_plen_463_part_00
MWPSGIGPRPGLSAKDVQKNITDAIAVTTDSQLTVGCDVPVRRHDQASPVEPQPPAARAPPLLLASRAPPAAAAQAAKKDALVMIAAALPTSWQSRPVPPLAGFTPLATSGAEPPAAQGEPPAAQGEPFAAQGEPPAAQREPPAARLDAAEGSEPSPEVAHRFLPAPALEARLEARRYRGKWAAVRGVAESNDSIMARRGFSVRPQKVRQTQRAPQASSAAAAKPALAWEQALPPPPPTEVVQLAAGGAPKPPRFGSTAVCVANVDTLSAALEIGDACMLNFANADTPGGRYRSGGRAQEEDLCRLLPQLHPSLATSGAYPIEPGTALLTRGLLAVRRPGTYELCQSMGSCAVVTAAMPRCSGRRPAGGWAGSGWAETVQLRIQAVLAAALRSGRPNLVLGAFGCGAFGGCWQESRSLFKLIHQADGRRSGSGRAQATRPGQSPRCSGTCSARPSSVAASRR